MTQKTLNSRLRVPEVGEECVSVSVFTLGRIGKRMDGIPDPEKKRVWVSWDNGGLEPVLIRSIVPACQFEFTLASKVRIRRENHD